MDNVFTIEDKDLSEARNVCSRIDSEVIRNRAVANVLGAGISTKYFDDSVTVDTISGLHNLATVLKDMDISDIYLNDSYIDVRLCFDENNMNVPKSQYMNSLLPVAYMFIKISENLSDGEVMGFILSESIDFASENSDYVKVDASKLVSFDEIKDYIEKTAEEIFINDTEIFSYIDGTLERKNEFYKKLLLSRNARQILTRAIKAQEVLDTLSETEEDTSLSEYANIDDLIPADDVEPEFLMQEGEIEPQPNNIEEIVEFTEEDLNAVSVDEPEVQSAMSYHHTEKPEENIEKLYNEEQVQMNIPEQPYAAEGFDINKIKKAQKRKSSGGLMVLLLLLLIGAAGYYVYTTYFQDSPQESIPNQTVTEDIQVSEDTTPINQEDVMPVESVTKPQNTNNKNEGTSVSIPAIEKNLDASVLVSKLNVTWEIPSGYVSNTSAKRYLYKLGKIIQLNLKTELLLLSKPPISNKITVEITYNNSEKCFEIVGIKDSSGEKTVDNLILETVKQALKTKISASADSFGKISGNPILIIKL